MNDMHKDTCSQVQKENRLEDLPLLLTISDIQRILRMSKTSVGYLIHQRDFPLVKLSPRKYIVPRDLFLQWIDAQANH